MGQALCCIQVEESTVAITETYGKFKDVLKPGYHCLPWCFGRQIAGKLSLRVQQLHVRCETKTEDNVFVNVGASIQYRALPEKEAFYKLSNASSQIQSSVCDVIGTKVHELKLDSVFDKKYDIAKEVKEDLQKAMSPYGFEIVQTLIVDIEPDEDWKREMKVKREAEEEKILQIKRAEGDAVAKYLSGFGMAKQFEAIVDGLRDSVVAFSEKVPGTTSKDVMEMVLVTQYIDTMKEIGASSKSNSGFIHHGPSTVRDIASQIRNGLLQANSTE